MISFEDCVNGASVTGSAEHVGGFVGLIDSNTNSVTMTISNTIINGNLTGSTYVGGLLGGLENN